MSFDAVLSTLWRRRLSFVLTFTACMAVVVAVTLALPKTYRATATVFVGTGASSRQANDSTFAEQLVRTYTSLAANANVADVVRGRLDSNESRSSLLAKMSFAPVERTRLLEISAEDDSPAGARRIANTYAGVFVQRVNQKAADDQAQATVSLDEPASLPDGAAKPNPPLYIGLGALLSLLLAAGVVALRERLDDHLEISDEDEDVLGEPILARIPDVKPSDSRSAPLLADTARLLKTNLDFLCDSPPRIVAVTSATPVEGKSLTAARLALAAMGDGEEVVLVEADLRRPGVEDALEGANRDGSGKGLTSYLVGAAGQAEVTRPVPGRRGLHVVLAGPLPPNPSGLLRSPRFGQLVRELRERYDRVIIDTPPVSIGADASIVVSHADAGLFVLDAHKSTRLAVRKGLSQLAAARPGRIGIVLNRVRAPRAKDHGYYSPGVGNGLWDEAGGAEYEAPPPRTSR
jgi:capsular exopolysaccharide synthesis family protein